MTSQKRYRHHEGNSANRFRDIPPRFKRQKSNSSPKTEDTVEDQENKGTEQTAIHHQTQPSTCAVTTPMAPANNFGQSLGPSPNSDLHSQRVNTPVSHPVLSQVENHYYNVQNHQWMAMNNRQQFATNTSGFASPQLYTWEPQYMPQINPQLQDHRLYYQPMVSRQDTLSPSLQMAHVKPSDSPSSIIQERQDNSASPLSSPTTRGQDANRSTPDFSDPDIRTIEMLRELERVADEKEKEDEKDPNDRKNLVSHHLRMLMCAVDRYTEGIEDDEPSTTQQNSLSELPTDKNSSKKKGSHQYKSAPPSESFQNKSNGRGNFAKTTSSSPQQTGWTGQRGEEGDNWHTVNRSRRTSAGGQAVAYNSRTPPPAHLITRTPPPPPSNPAISPVSPKPSRTPSPYMQQPGQAYTPMRAITKYNNDPPVNTPPASPYNQGPANSVAQVRTSPCSPSFSPAPSPPLKNIWGPPSMDSPTDAKSWDLWTSPSFMNDVYQAPRGNMAAPGMVPFAAYMNPVVPYTPEDLKDQLPLYRR